MLDTAQSPTRFLNTGGVDNGIPLGSFDNVDLVNDTAAPKENVLMPGATYVPCGHHVFTTRIKTEPTLL